MAQYSHVVKSLKFGTQFPPRGRNRVVDPGMELEGLSALEDRVYTTDALHTAPHHYIKVGFLLLRGALEHQQSQPQQSLPCFDKICCCDDGWVLAAFWSVLSMAGSDVYRLLRVLHGGVVPRLFGPPAGCSG